MKNKFGVKAISLLLSVFMIAGLMVFTTSAEEAAADPFADYSKWDGVTYDTSPFKYIKADNGGEAVSTFPVVINSAAQLAGLSQVVNEAKITGNYGAFLGLNIYITVNIDLCGHEFQSIGREYGDAMFSGNLEGRLNNEEGKPVTIANLKESDISKNNTGFIGNLRGGSVKNLTFVNAVVGNLSCRYASGLVVGYASKNCEISGISVIDSTIIVPRSNDDTGAGGVLGLIKADNEVVLKDIYVDNLTFACPEYFGSALGGIIGMYQSRKPITIENGYFSGQAVSAVEGHVGEIVSLDTFAAGFVGKTATDKADPAITFKNCHYNGNLAIAGDSVGNAGAFVGDFIYGGSITMENCLDTGYCQDEALISYAAGTLKLEMTNCYTILDKATLGVNASDVTEPKAATVVTAESILGDTAATTLAGFDFQNVWKTNDKAMPTLPGVASAEFVEVAAPEIKETDYTALNEQIAAAEALTEAEYTAESWAALKTALDGAKAALTVDKQNDVDAAATALAEAIAALAKAEPKDDEPKDDEPKDDEPKPEEPKDDEPKDEPKKGCGSSITLVGFAMVAVLGTAAVVVTKKKED